MQLEASGWKGPARRAKVLYCRDMEIWKGRATDQCRKVASQSTENRDRGGRYGNRKCCGSYGLHEVGVICPAVNSKAITDQISKNAK